jgi:hypothetical protein
MTQATISSIVWTVPSSTTPGAEYRVCAISPTGLLTCSCRAGQFNKLCKHVRSVVAGSAGRPVVRATVHAQPCTVGTVDDLY